MTVPGRMVLASGNAPYARSITLWAPDCLRTGDTLAVWKLDRLGRSVKEVLTIADDLYARRRREDPHRQAVRQLLTAR